MSSKFNFHSNLTRIAGTLHEDLCTFMIISCSILLRTRNVSDNSCRENHNPHFMFNNSFSENRAFYEIMWKNMVEPDRPQITIWHMRIACWITKATETYSVCNTACFCKRLNIKFTRKLLVFVNSRKQVKYICTRAKAFYDAYYFENVLLTCLLAKLCSFSESRRSSKITVLSKQTILMVHYVLHHYQ
jgi:hypothetical protein